MLRYVKKLAWLFCLLITCNLNPTYPNGKSSFAAAHFLRFTPQSSKYINKLCPPYSCRENNEIFYGIVLIFSAEESKIMNTVSALASTKNPKSIRRRIEVAINKRTGGSYALAQRWVHNMSLLEETNEWIGRTLKESYELANKRDVSHVASNVGC
ncbi:putative iron-dependent peroxidase, partial [Schistosoma japonicum]